MFVRSLRLAGFKSFADPTVLEFEPGVNVIVGPNGSGKSNIADALQWVLGSQAPSSLRGGSMEDVIFAGAAGRPRLGMAEVELTLDNSSGILPLDVAEVTISRSADRTGVSEYRINGASCRLLDVAELLSDTGIGRSLHSLVGQGQLDAVLQAHPEERRSFIEEAAQIGKFRRRKERALRKIERVDGNLTRVGDILSELRRAARPLKRQAAAAQAHSTLVTEHLALRRRLAATEIQRLSLEERELDLAGEAQRAGLLSDELAHIRARLGTAARAREATVREAEQTQGTLHRMSLVTDRLGALAQLAAERVERISARLTAETEEGYRERIRLLDIQEHRFRGEETSLAAEVERGAAGAAAARREHESHAGRARDLETELDRAREQETSAIQTLVRAEGAEAAGRASVASVVARLDSIQERRDVARSELAKREAEMRASAAEVRALQGRLDGATESAAAAESSLEQARARAEGLRERLAAAHAGRAAAAARVDTLAEVAALLADLSGATERLEPLVDEGRERLRLASAGEDSAAGILARADGAIEEQWQVVAGCDEDLKRLDALLSGAAERLAGARRAREAREIELAALDDELARTQEGLAAAERAAAEERAGLPGRRAAAAKVSAERAAAEKALAAAREEAERSRRTWGAAELEERGVEERRLIARLRIEEAEAGIADARRSLEGISDLRSSLRAAGTRAERIAMVASRAAEHGGRWSSDAQRRAERARSEAKAAEHALARLRSRERELEVAVEHMATRRNRSEVRRAEIRARAQALSERAMEEWGLAAQELLAEDSLAEPEEARARRRVEELEREMRGLGAVNPRAAEEYAEVAERETFLVDQTEDLKASRRDLLAIVREVDETVVKVFGDAFDAVASEFEGVFQRLFPGGNGRLTLTDPEDVLGSGIEIEARPPGKNVSKLSLLSGGERSLVALAFLFSIFRSLPSPFYLLDEVEAALDDVNLARFLTLTGELEERAQVMIVTHQKRTMETATVLYGITMASEGVSRVVAQRVDEVAV